MKWSFSLLFGFVLLLIANMTGYAQPKGAIRVAVPTFSYESVDPIHWATSWGNMIYDP